MQSISSADNILRRWSIQIGRSYDSENRTVDIGMVSDSFGKNPAFYVAPKGVEAMRINSSGDVGIGTTNPANKFEVFKDSGNEIIAQFRTQDGIINIAAAGSTTGNSSYGNFISSRNSDNTAYEDIGLKTASGNPQLLVKTDGSVGVGTTHTFGYKLAVNGTIGSTEVKVENTSAWPDFVFEKDYDLRTLKELEEHITEKGHLPEIPSEEEITENGINLGEMNAKLLQKIEELTLYLIEQNKEIKELKKEVSNLKNQ